MREKIKNYLLTKIANIFHALLERDDIKNRIKDIFKEIITDDGSQEAILKVLENEKIYHQSWINNNIRPPETSEFSYASFPNDLTEESFKLASKQSAEYIHDKMGNLYGIPDPIDLLSACIKEVKLDGLYLEFGVFSGRTINHIATKTDQTVHGFDSFQGLPEEWNSVPAGTFSTNGKLPSVANNVQLHVGYFEETLPVFVSDFSDDVAFLHIDSDLYSSARIVLKLLKDQIKAGTIIVFDEYFNYPGWQNHEYKAFKEFISESGFQYEYIAFCSKGFSVGVRIL
jgi:hypothetical protein